jgi:hypothetical protein
LTGSVLAGVVLGAGVAIIAGGVVCFRRVRAGSGRWIANTGNVALIERGTTHRVHRTANTIGAIGGLTLVLRSRTIRRTHAGADALPLSVLGATGTRTAVGVFAADGSGSAATGGLTDP